MAEPNRTLITFENGLDEFTEASRLAEGYASALRDWVPEADGSLRVRIGWLRQANGGFPAARAVRGIGYNPKHKHTGDVDFTPAFLVANRINAGEYQFSHIMADDLDDPAILHVNLENVLVTDAEKFVPMEMAGGRLLYVTDDFATIRAYDGVAGTAAAIAGSKVGRTLTYFRNRVFVGGGKETADPAGTPQTANTFSTQPWRLWWSGLADINAWDTTSLTNPAGFVDVSKDDGQPIECVRPFDQGLLVGKSESAFYLAGTGPSSFQLLPLDAGECAPGDSICVTPFGAVLVGKTDIYLYDGNYPVPIERPVSLSWDATRAKFISCAYQDGVIYIVNPGQEIIAYDFSTQAWHKEKWHNAAANQVSVVRHQEDMLVMGTRDSVTEPLLRYRRIPVGARVVDEGSAGAYLLRSPELWLGGAPSPATLRHAYLRLRQRGTGGTGLIVRCYRNGTLVSTKTIAPRAAAGTYRQRLDFGPTAYSLQLEAEMTPAPGQATFDIEELEIDWMREKDR